MNIDYKKLNAACKKHNINYYKTAVLHTCWDCTFLYIENYLLEK